VVLTATVLKCITSFYLKYPRLRLSRTGGFRLTSNSLIKEYSFTGCKGNATQRPAKFRVDVSKPMIMACKIFALQKFRRKRLYFFHKRQYVKSAGVSINLSVQQLEICQSTRSNGEKQAEMLILSKVVD
jgi:hypothetical protein